MTPYCLWMAPIVRSFEIFSFTEICRASHVTENLTQPCAEIKAVMDLKLSVLLVRTTKNIHKKFQVDHLYNVGTGVFSIFGHVTCPANYLIYIAKTRTRRTISYVRVFARKFK